jgi:DNA-binding transcriptional LysR family regulator
MARFLKRYPQIELLISNESSAMVTTSVVERRANFGLVVNPHPHPDLVIVKLFHDAMDVLIAANAPPPSIRLPSIPAEATKSSRPARPSSSERSPGSDSPSPDGEGQPQGFAEGTSERSDPAFLAATQRLLAGPLIYAGRVTQCQELCDLLAAQGLLSTRKLVCGDLELVKSLVLAGIGPALLPRRVAAYGHEGKLVRLHPSLPFIPDTICLVYRADMHQTKAALRVKDELIAHGRELDTEVHAVWNPLAV